MNRSSPFDAAPAPVPDADGWQATRAQTSVVTQFIEEREYLATESMSEIGRQTGANERELFVSCAPDLALQQQFEHAHPEFIAVHDIATNSSRRLLAGIAAASKRAVQRLVIRRQGYGNALATLEFVELPTADGSSLRMYSTEADADTSARHGLAHMLLAYSRLGVFMVGDLPGHAIASALKPFHDFMVAGPWPNRQVLLLPLAAGSTLVTQGLDLARGTPVNVRTTPQVSRPADAWGFINGTWARIRGAAHGADDRGSSAVGESAVGEASHAESNDYPNRVERRGPDRLAMRPMPPVPTAASRAASAPQSLLERYVEQLSELPGMVSCCVFDVASGLEVSHAGARPGAADLAMHGKALLAGMSASSRSMGLGHTLPEAAITLNSHHLLLRAVPGHPGLALHAALDKSHANLTLARLQIQRMDAMLDSRLIG